MSDEKEQKDLSEKPGQPTTESAEASAKVGENASPQTSPGQPAAAETVTDADAEKEAKAKAAAEARAARAAARAAAKGEADAGAEGVQKQPSPKQPLLDKLVQLLKENVSEEAVESAAVNELDDHLPTLTIRAEHWSKAARWLKSNPELGLTYLRNLSGVDFEAHMEVVYHLYAMEQRQEVCVKVKTSREQASVPSVTPVWAGANWNEREVYDLLGIDFPGHPDLRRIMMPDDWQGYPLRKDYEQLDPEV